MCVNSTNKLIFNLCILPWVKINSQNLYLCLHFHMTIAIKKNLSFYYIHANASHDWVKLMMPSYLHTLINILTYTIVFFHIYIFTKLQRNGPQCYISVFFIRVNYKVTKSKGQLKFFGRNLSYLHCQHLCQQLHKKLGRDIILLYSKGNKT